MKKLLLLSLSLLLVQLNYASAWNQKTKFPAVGRHRGTGISIGDKGYIGLGHMNGTGTNVIYDDWWEFDPATNSWTQKASYPTPNYGALAFSVGNKGYVGGGTQLGNEFYEFDPITNIWSSIADCLNEYPSDETAFTINDKGYILSGSDFLEYTPATDTWMYKATCPLSGWGLTSFSINNSGFIKEGVDLYEYKQSADQWTSRASFPGLTNNGAPAFSIGNKGYVVTGYSGFLNPVNSEMWEYDPALNSWMQLSDFEGTSRRFAVAFTIGAKGYFGTGTNGTNMNDFWEFNPSLEGVGIEENEQVEVLTYPNPATTSVTIELQDIWSLETLNLAVYSNQGVLVRSEEIHTNKIVLDRNQLSSGSYYYTINSSEKRIANGRFIFK